MGKSSLVQNLIIERMKAGENIMFLSSEGSLPRWNKWRSSEQKEDIQNRWNARNLKRHLDHNSPERQIRKI